MAMLRPIPKRILTQTMTIHVPSAMDADQNVTYTDTVVSHVHFQSDHRTLKQKDNTEIQTTGIIFADTRYSRPELDYLALSAQAEAVGAQGSPPRARGKVWAARAAPRPSGSPPRARGKVPSPG